MSILRRRIEEWSACSGRSGYEVRVRFCFSLTQRRMVQPAVVVAATRSASDSVFCCRKEEWFRLQNATTPRLQRFLISRGKLWNRCKETLKNSQTAASILDFRARLGNRCRVLPVYTLFRASILDFRAELGNRCKDFPVYCHLHASILDFVPRLENRCKVFPVYGHLRASILDFRTRFANHCSTIVAAVWNGPPATAVAATTFRVRF